MKHKKRSWLTTLLFWLLPPALLLVGGLAFFFYDVSAPLGGLFRGIGGMGGMGGMGGLPTINAAAPQATTAQASSLLDNPLMQQVVQQMGITKALQQQLPTSNATNETTTPGSTLNLSELTHTVAKQYGFEAAVPHLEKNLQPDQLIRLVTFGNNDEFTSFKQETTASHIRITAQQKDTQHPFEVTLKKEADGGVSLQTLTLPENWGVNALPPTAR